MIDGFTAEQVESFRRDGFLVVEEGLVSERGLELLRERYLRLFEGEYETGIRPDEVNWVPGRDPEDRTRQLCNAWKSDTVVAAQVLSERTGRLAAQLMGYRGVRWLSLHDTAADAGPLEFVRGSNHWPTSPPERTQFHAPDDWSSRPAVARSLDESFFPVVWDESGYRTPWLAELPDLG